MTYLKCALAGLITLLVAIISLPVFVVAGLVVNSKLHPPRGEGTIGWDPISLVRTDPMICLVAAVFVFCAGFIWQYRKLTE